MMRPKCLVLLAAFNGTQWIEEQLSSILAQEGVDVTVLISVDKSVDGTELLVDQYCVQDDRVHCLPHDLRFGGAAKNFFRLIKDAPIEDFDYFALSDQDDIWLPRKLTDAVAKLTSFEAQAYSSDVIAFWPDGRKKLVKKSQKQVEYDYLFEAAGPGCTYVFTPYLFSLLKKHITDVYTQLDCISLHDWYIYAYTRSNGYKWIIDSRANMYYRQHSNNQVGVNTGLRAFRKRLSSVFDGWYLRQAACIANLIGIQNNSFVNSWIDLDRRGVLNLAFNGNDCRRRRRDKFVFAIICLVLTVKGNK
ncbi:glycosyltransferase [Pseudomonas saxonica]|uniref:Glycosyltransferase n=1 Tax=Pseudomonas saxonica TaxID=2600598 RepID=A0ABY3GKU3_9PSED|nr:glycosyltransferase [Pseudomonas saxonica]TWR92318.1 glycosyltransferase [Pseudomonas saxonica]